jgi:hypothetical protein
MVLFTDAGTIAQIVTTIRPKSSFKNVMCIDCWLTAEDTLVTVASEDLFPKVVTS